MDPEGEIQIAVGVEGAAAERRYSADQAAGVTAIETAPVWAFAVLALSTAAQLQSSHPGASASS